MIRLLEDVAGTHPDLFMAGAMVVALLIFTVLCTLTSWAYVRRDVQRLVTFRLWRRKTATVVPFAPAKVRR